MSQIKWLDMVDLSKELSKITGINFQFGTGKECITVLLKRLGEKKKRLLKFPGVTSVMSFLQGMKMGFDLGYKKAEQDEEDELLFLEHGGLKIYATYLHGHEQDPMSDNFYSTVNDGNPESDFAFDVDDLDPIPENAYAKYTDLYPNNDDKKRIAYAIDQEQITEEGLKA